MDAVTLQPAAGAHGELTGILMIRAYHEVAAVIRAAASWCRIQPTAQIRRAWLSRDMSSITFLPTRSGIVDLEALRRSDGRRCRSRDDHESQHAGNL